MKKYLYVFRITSIFLLLVFVSSCTTQKYSKHKVANPEVLLTEVFLDHPDSAVYMYNQTEKKLSQENKTKIFNSFSTLMTYLLYTDSFEMPFNMERIDEWRDNNISIEFRYNQRHEFTGSLPHSSDSTDYFTWGGSKFEAFLLIYYSGSLIAVPYLEDTYVGINDLFLVLDFPEEALTTFIETLNEAIK